MNLFKPEVFSIALLFSLLFATGGQAHEKSPVKESRGEETRQSSIHRNDIRFDPAAASLGKSVQTPFGNSNDEAEGVFKVSRGQSFTGRTISLESQKGNSDWVVYRRNFVSRNLGLFEITAYTNGPESTGKIPGDPAYGVTATGTFPEEGRTIAADWSILPPGTVVQIDGLPGTFVVEDRGGAMRGRKIDLFIPDLDKAIEFGRQKHDVKVIIPIER